jgi:DNA ligase-1
MFRPMKPPSGVLEDEDLHLLRFPLIASPKIDGIRMSVQDSHLLSSTLKDIPNKYVREILSHPSFNDLDGEGCVGSVTDGKCFNRSTSLLMSDEEPITESLVWYVFDKFVDNLACKHRQHRACLQLLSCEDTFGLLSVKWLKQTVVQNLQEFLDFEKKCIDEGYEGAMYRNPDAFYKQGRSTLTGQELMRRKPFEDAEAVVIGWEEGETNTNPKVMNGLGLAKRGSSKSGKVKNGTLGNYLVKGLTAFKDIDFSITAFGTDEENKERWNNRDRLIGKIIKYKYQKYGSKDRPRIATGIGFRSDLDL